MQAINEWWWRQLIEKMKEASALYQRFIESPSPMVDDFDKAMQIYQECQKAYELKENFKEFIEIGKSLRARQAHKYTQEDYDNE